ncbi:MAG: hypothetical protein ACMVY4_15460 [Minwuia sp.]|uniref:hypothetical protein n=1 Tax=Minwuia sp. TaxID=2493630 RepID=UPI003A899642
MAVFRDRLRELRPRRAPTLDRLLCLPFEPFITEADLPAQQQVPRQFCLPYVRLVKALLGRKRVDAHRKALSSIEAGDHMATIRAGAPIWREAAAKLRRARIDRKRGGTRDCLDLIIGCLECGEPLAEIVLRLPRGQLGLPDEHIKAFAARMVRQTPVTEVRRLRFAAMALAGRMANPFAVLALFQDPGLAMEPIMRRRMIDIAAHHLQERLSAQIASAGAAMSESGTAPSGEELRTVIEALRALRQAKAAGIDSGAQREFRRSAKGYLHKAVLQPVAGIVRAVAPDVEEIGQGACTETDDASHARWIAGRVQAFAALESRLGMLSELEPDLTAIGLRMETVRAGGEAAEALRQRIDATSAEAVEASGGAQLRLWFEAGAALRLLEILEGTAAAMPLWRRLRRMKSGSDAAAA